MCSNRWQWRLVSFASWSYQGKMWYDDILAIVAKNKEKVFIRRPHFIPFSQGRKSLWLRLWFLLIQQCNQKQSYLSGQLVIHSLIHCGLIEANLSLRHMSVLCFMYLSMRFDALGIPFSIRSWLHLLPKGEGGSSSSFPKVTKPTCRREASNWELCAYGWVELPPLGWERWKNWYLIYFYPGFELK